MKDASTAAPSGAKAPRDAEPSQTPARKNGPGRPRLCGESLRVVAFKVPASIADAFDAMLVQLGETRSSRLRMLVERDVEAYLAEAAPGAADAR